MAYVSKINGYDIKDKEAHGRLDIVEQKLVEGVGKIDEIYLNETKLDIVTNESESKSKAITIETDGDYSKDNKLATVSTVDNAVQGILGDGVNEAYDTFKEMQTYIETHGSEAVGMANNITQNSKDIDALEQTVENLGLAENYDEKNETLDLSLGNGGTTSSGNSGNSGLYSHNIALYVYNELNNYQSHVIHCEMLTRDSTSYDFTAFLNKLKELNLVGGDNHNKLANGYHKSSPDAVPEHVIAISLSGSTLEATYLSGGSSDVYGSGVSGRRLTIYDTVIEI